MNRELLEKALILGVALDTMQQEEYIEEVVEEVVIEEEYFELEPFKLSRTFTIEISED